MFGSITMNVILQSVIVVMLIAVATPIAIQASDAVPTIYTARTINTMNPDQPTASAVAVKEGDILAVGSLESVQKQLAGTPYRIDKRFQHKVLMPGFIDPHQHVLAAALTASLPNVAYYDTMMPDGSLLPGVKSKESAFERLRTHVKTLGEAGEILIVYGYDPIALDGHLTRHDLDQISLDVPLVVWDASTHNLYVNSAFIELKGLESLPHMTGVERDDKGQLTGTLLGNNVIHPILFPLLENYLAPENRRALVLTGIELYRQGGVTTIGEMAFGGLNPDLEEPLLPAIYNDSRVPIRAVAAIHEPKYVATRGGQAEAVSHALDLQAHNTDKFIYSGVKFLADDAFLSLTMRATYRDGHEGLWLMAPEEMVNRLLPWWKAGFRIHIHSNGDQSQDAVLSALAELQQKHPRSDHRFTFEHYGISTPEQTERLSSLGALASVNPWYVYFRGELNEQQLGQEASHNSSRLKTLVDAGVVTALHTDTPVAPPLPLMSAWVAVNRLGQSGKVLAPEERLTVHTALRMITIDAAYVLGLEQRVGSIEPGKRADFTVLEEDPYMVDPLHLKDISIWGTVFGGRPFPLEN